MHSIEDRAMLSADYHDHDDQKTVLTEARVHAIIDEAMLSADCHDHDDN